MEQDTLETVNQCIRDAAQQAAASDGLSAMLIERFLLEKRPEKECLENRPAALLRLLGNLLPAEARPAPPAPPDTIRKRIEPMVAGLVQLKNAEIQVAKMLVSG